MTQIDLPEGLESIGEDAFYASGLKSIVIPASLKYVSKEVFGNCENLVQATISEGATCVLPNLFSYCKGLQKVILPNGITEIGEWAFASCGNLKEINLPKSIKKINNCAFYECEKLSPIDLPEGLESLGRNVFNGSGLESVMIPASLQSVSEDGCENFEYCKKLNRVTFAEGAACVLPNLFSHCKSLQKVILPNSITEIGESAFRECEALSEINLPKGLTKIGNYAFLDCNLKAITIPKNIVQIGSRAIGYKFVKVDEKTYRYEKIEGFIITGYNSVAQSYAEKNGFTYRDLSGGSEVTPSGRPTPPINPSVQPIETSDDEQQDKPRENKKSVETDDGIFKVTTTTVGEAAIVQMDEEDEEDIEVDSYIAVDGVDYKVTCINAYAFKNAKSAKTVKLPNTIKKIKANAFAKSKIKTVKITVKKGAKITIDKKAFKKSKVKKVQLVMSKKATKKEKNAVIKALTKAGIKKANIKVKLK